MYHFFEQLHKDNSHRKINGWSRFQDHAFERAIRIFPEGTEDRWEKVARQVPGQSPAKVKEHYDVYVHDIELIESGNVELPDYLDDLVSKPTIKDDGPREKTPSTCGKKMVQYWTKEEHELFLSGLKIYGRGNWKSISKYVVKSKTATQVASHAQKYFIRVATTKEKKRTSIHDTVSGGNDSVPHLIHQQNLILPSNATMQ
ncbi:SANT/Myb domain [Sesbania bispinosa]|nr:SANT/Myb domain [Sesbania bispinosa]